MLHSQRWWVHGIWCFLTTLQLVYFQLSLHYHLNQHRHFWQKQQLTIFALSCCTTRSLRFFCSWAFLLLFFSHSFTNALASSKWRRICCLHESYSLQRFILIRTTQEYFRFTIAHWKINTNSSWFQIYNRCHNFGNLFWKEHFSIQMNFSNNFEYLSSRDFDFFMLWTSFFHVFCCIASFINLHVLIRWGLHFFSHFVM